MREIIKTKLPQNCRIIAVSDIHTCWYLLDKVLKKAEYRPGKDFLVIVGDILEHWDQNLQTLDYVMKICKNDRVYCLKGNNDTASYHMALHYDYQKFMYKRSRKPHNTFLQMAEKLGITEFPEDKFEELRREVYSSFTSELEFLRTLPYVFETQEHIFIHAGIENRRDWENTSNTFALTHPFFLRENQCSGKWVVVGHFPCYNYKRSNNTNLPIIDEKKKMICIDGGLTIKSACQLNALCINKCGNNYSFETVWDTFFEKKSILEDFNSTLSPVYYIDPYNNKPEIIGTENSIAHVRDIITGIEGFIPEGVVHHDEKGLRLWNNLNAFLTVRKNDSVHFCRSVGKYAQIITENGQVGWIPEKIL